MKELIFEGLGMMYMLAVIVMVMVVVAMAVDFVSGWRKAKLRGDEHNSYAASRTLTKFLIYEGMCIIGICMDTMIHFAWVMFTDSAYYVPLMTVLFGITLCIVEAWSVKEKADKKQRKRMEDAAAALANILDKETVMELLRPRLRNIEPGVSLAENENNMEG
jgi:flagellar basal body-associated protein FliL